MGESGGVEPERFVDASDETAHGIAQRKRRGNDAYQTVIHPIEGAGEPLRGHGDAFSSIEPVEPLLPGDAWGVECPAQVEENGLQSWKRLPRNARWPHPPP